MNRGLERHYEETPALHTVAQREEDAAEEEEEDDDEDGQQALDDTTVAKAKGKAPTLILTNGDNTANEAEQVTTGAPTPHSVHGISEREMSASPVPGGSQPSTPLPNGHGMSFATPHSTINSLYSIPASRFEIFPPIPGMSARRRPGRPFGSRTRNRTMTPIRRNDRSFVANGNTSVTAGVGSPGPAAGNANGRRTRSMLVEGEMVEFGMVNGTGEEVGDVDEDVLMADAEEKNDDVEGVVDEDIVRKEENGESGGEGSDADGEAEDE
jgi:histone acetyltransferase SAS3